MYNNPVSPVWPHFLKWKQILVEKMNLWEGNKFHHKKALAGE
jgi:hypothetical protein